MNIRKPLFFGVLLIYLVNLMSFLTGHADYTVGELTVSADGTSASIEVGGELPEDYKNSVLVAAVYNKYTNILERVELAYIENNTLTVSAGSLLDSQTAKYFHISDFSTLKPLGTYKTENDAETELDSVSYGTPIIDFADSSALETVRVVHQTKADDGTKTNTYTSVKASSKHTMKDDSFSLHWAQHSENDGLEISSFADGISNDWSDAVYIKANIYSAKATGATLCLMIHSRRVDNKATYYYTKFPIDWKGWKTIYFSIDAMTATREPDITDIQKINIWANGEMSTIADDETELWIASLDLILASKYDFVRRFYEPNTISRAYASLDGSVGVFAGGSNAVIANGKQSLNYSIDIDDGVVMVPVQLFADYLGADVSQTDGTFNVYVGGRELSGIVGEADVALGTSDILLSRPSYLKDSQVYIPGEEVASLLGFSAFTDGRLLCIGTEDMKSKLRRTANRGINQLSEIVAQEACMADINIDTVTDSDIETAKANWRKMLVGDETNDTSVSDKINIINKNCAASRALLLANSAGTTIFEGIGMTRSEDMDICYDHVRNMALAYGCYGSEYYHDAEILSDIIYAFDWLGKNYYNAEARAEWEDTTLTGLNNWHSWDIDVPQAIIETLLCIEDNLDTDDIASYLDYFYTRVTTPISTAANYSHSAQLIAGAALLNGDAETVMQMAVNLLRTHLYVDDNKRIVENKIVPRDFEVLPRGSGFFTDGSYVFHTFHAMNGTYGVKHFKAITDFQRVMQDTAFDVKSALKYNTAEFFFNTFDPVIYGTTMFKGVLGRSDYPTNVYTGIPVLTYAFSVADSFDDATRDKIYSIVKAAYINSEFKNTFIEYLTINEVEDFLDVMNSDVVEPRSGRRMSRTLYNIDKAYHMRDSWAIGISMSSSRIFNYESLNNENTKGWYLGDGRTEWLLSDSKMSGNKINANKDYWQYMDPYRLPGTTVDTQERKAVSIYQGNEYLSSKDFVGGVSLNDEYGAVAMELESYHNDDDFGVNGGGYGGLAPAHKCDLVAKKAYFMLDDGVICLGTDINAKDNNNAEVLTIVENFAIADGVKYGSDVITADGENIVLTGADSSLSNSRWINYSGICGYVFPDADENSGMLKARRTSADKSYFELWFSHGVNPTASTYAYILLPGSNSEQTKAFAEGNNVTILENTSSVQAAHDERTGVTYIVFWQAGTFNGITVSKPCLLITRETDSEFAVAVSDPTQKLNELALTLPEEYTLKDADECAMITGKTISFDLTEAVGRSLELLYSK